METLDFIQTLYQKPSLDAYLIERESHVFVLISFKVEHETLQQNKCLNVKILGRFLTMLLQSKIQTGIN